MLRAELGGLPRSGGAELVGVRGPRRRRERSIGRSSRPFLGDRRGRTELRPGPPLRCGGLFRPPIRGGMKPDRFPTSATTEARRSGPRVAPGSHIGAGRLRGGEEPRDRASGRMGRTRSTGRPCGRARRSGRPGCSGRGQPEQTGRRQGRRFARGGAGWYLAGALGRSGRSRADARAVSPVGG